MPRHNSKADPTVSRDELVNSNLSDEDLPHHNDPLWVKRRKIGAVAAARGGIIPLHEALKRFHISAEEFVEWEREVGDDLLRKRRLFRETKAGRSMRAPGRKETQ